MRRLALILSLCASGWLTEATLAFATEQSVTAKVDDTEDIAARVERFLSLVAASDSKTISTEGFLGGELSGADLSGGGNGPQKVDKIVLLEKDKAVARCADIVGQPNEYLYLTKVGENWQIHTIRSLALPRFLWDLKDDLAATPNRSADSEAMYQNLLLTTRSDGELRNWFFDHKQELDEMRVLTPVFEKFSEDGMSNRRLSNSARTNDLVAALHLNYAEMEDGNFNVSVGGILDNSVGFLYADAENVPKISPSEYIWVEPLGDGWYLYRTT